MVFCVVPKGVNLCRLLLACSVHPNRKAAPSNGSAWIAPDVPTLDPPVRYVLPLHLCWTHSSIQVSGAVDDSFFKQLMESLGHDREVLACEGMLDTFIISEKGKGYNQAILQDGFRWASSSVADECVEKNFQSCRLCFQGACGLKIWPVLLKFSNLSASWEKNFS